MRKNQDPYLNKVFALHKVVHCILYAEWNQPQKMRDLDWSAQLPRVPGRRSSHKRYSPHIIDAVKKNQFDVY